MDVSAIKFLRQIRYPEERVVEIIDLLKKCVYRSDAERCYDLFAGGFSWGDEIPYGFSSKEGVLNSEGLVNLDCSLYLRPMFAYRASLTRGKPCKDYQEEWDELKNRVPAWPGFREERIFGEDIKRMLEDEEKEMWGEDYDEAMDGD